MRAAELLASFVAIDTTSSRSNTDLIEKLAEQGQALGFDARVDTVRDERGVEKANLFLTAGPDGDTKAHARTGGLAFVGHTDTVPFDDAWKEALSLTERDGNLYGRGAADTKGFIACVLAAIEETDLARLSRPLTLCFTHDEETGCLGAKRIAQEGQLRPSYAIVGEPTSLRPIRAHKGYCLADVELRGKEGHSAYPDLGVNSIFHAGRILRAVEVVAREIRETTDPLFEPPFTTVNVGRIDGGRAKNVIPGRTHFTLEWRPIPGQDVERVRSRLAEAVEELRREDPTIDCTITKLRADPGVATPADSALVRFLEEASGKPSSTVSFATEAPYLAALGAEPVVFGPGDIRVAHRTGEFVPVVDLVNATRIFKDAIRRFCIQDA